MVRMALPFFTERYLLRRDRFIFMSLSRLVVGNSNNRARSEGQDLPLKFNVAWNYVTPLNRCKEKIEVFCYSVRRERCGKMTNNWTSTNREQRERDYGFPDYL